MGWFSGTASQVADQLMEWQTKTGVDGFNLIPCPPTAGIDDICTLLIPELQRRGRFRLAYNAEEHTLRERYFGAGNHRYGWARAAAAPSYAKQLHSVAP
jgi:hypothetical protein